MKFSREKFQRIRKEAEPLVAAHWHETEESMYGPNPLATLDSLEPLDGLGVLAVLAARDDSGKLQGYCAFIITPNAMSGGRLEANLAGFFLSEAARGWTGLAMLRESEDMLKERGAEAVFYHSPESRPCDALYRRLGAARTETVFYKEL